MGCPALACYVTVGTGPRHRGGGGSVLRSVNTSQLNVTQENMNVRWLLRCCINLTIGFVS
jgi:hypothetical protein